MDIILLFAAVAGLIWVSLYAQHSSMLMTCTLFVIVGSCFGHAFYNTDIGPAPITLDRLLWCGLVIQFIYFHFAKQDEPKPLRVTDYIFVAYIAYLGLNTFITDWSHNGYSPVAHLLFFYILPAGVYWIARQTKLEEKDFRLFTLMMTGFGLYLSVTAIAETREWWFMVFPGYIASTEVTSEFFGRGRGPFLNPISCGIFQILCFCCMLTWWPRVEKRGKITIAALSLVFLIGIFCTLTRSVWLALFVAGGLMVWLNVTRGTRGLLIAGAVAVLAVGSLMFGEHISSFKRDKHVTETQMAKSAELRPILAAIAFDMAMDKPLFGCGLAQYSENSIPYHNNPHWNMPIQSAKNYVQHNMFLASLVETGLIGLILLVALLACWGSSGWNLWHSKKSPLWVRQFGMLQLVVILALVVNGMFHDTLIISMTTTLVFFMSGLTSGLASKYLAVPEKNEFRTLVDESLNSGSQTDLGIQPQ